MANKTIGDGLIDHGTQIHNNVAPSQTYPGMAHWAGSGPAKTCFQCAFWGRELKQRSAVKKGECAKFKQLTQKKGGKVPKGARACKYFEERSNGNG